MVFVPCDGCRRHVRVSDASCPFCATHRTASAPLPRPQHARLARSALMALSVSALACGSTSTVDVADVADGGGAGDAGSDTSPEVRTKIDGSSADMGAIYGGAPPPIGNPCTTTADCRVSDYVCTAGAFGGDSLYPTSICVGTGCDPGDGTTFARCDDYRGLCLGTSSGSMCLPACFFGDDGAAPMGCLGKNKCHIYGWSRAPDGLSGIGYCFGGCVADADCPAGNVCQSETALCVKTRAAYPKAPGTACTSADAKAPAQCNCLYETKTGSGYCANSCHFGETTCGAGFTCDSGLPKTPLRADDVVFTKVPLGLAGSCLKNCATDADCVGLNAYCDEGAGTAQKICRIGTRRCVDDTQCPTGKTCKGATMTTIGTCT